MLAPVKKVLAYLASAWVFLGGFKLMEMNEPQQHPCDLNVPQVVKIF